DYYCAMWHSFVLGIF
nr:immunoglobulin light chain junction region [Macaca mulatta]